MWVWTTLMLEDLTDVDVGQCKTVRECKRSVATKQLPFWKVCISNGRDYSHRYGSNQSKTEAFKIWILKCLVFKFEPSLYSIYFCVAEVICSNHLNTEHLKSEYLTFRTLFCAAFKWSDVVIRQTVCKPDIFCPVFRPPFKNQTIWQPGMFGPFE